mmetsp:Transcript_16089/g.15447  ORF Transcript_16089/g.15447 Transcript_16089/m.15447 type:complete len:254 (+) Transcript_16089:2945-3706(+)
MLSSTSRIGCFITGTSGDISFIPSLTRGNGSGVNTISSKASKATGASVLLLSKISALNSTLLLSGLLDLEGFFPLTGVETLDLSPLPLFPSPLTLPLFPSTLPLSTLFLFLPSILPCLEIFLADGGGITSTTSTSLGVSISGVTGSGTGVSLDSSVLTPPPLSFNSAARLNATITSPKIYLEGTSISQIGLKIMFAGKEGTSSTTGVDFFLPSDSFCPLTGEIVSVGSRTEGTMSYPSIATSAISDTNLSKSH